MPQVAFGGVFNYGFINKPKTRRQKAEAIVNRQATKASIKSATLLSISPTVETMVLSENTIRMCRKICETYEMPGGTATALLSQLTGSFIGKAAASYIGKLFPGAGNLANATITYALHEVQGRIIIKWCEENYKNPDVKSFDLVAQGFRMFAAIESLGGNPVDSLGEDGFQL